MNVLSLFDGMSCGRLALERAGIGYDKYFASEIDNYAIQIAGNHYPDNINLGDITGVGVEDLPEINLLIGGSPCQGFSTAGKELNFDDPRSKLFFEYVRLLKETKPKHFLLENVGMKKEFRDIISSHIGCEPIMFNASLITAQNRPRFFWTNIEFDLPDDRGIMVPETLGIEGAIIGQLQPYPRDYKKRGLKRKTRVEYRTDGKSNTLLAGKTQSNLLKIDSGSRVLTPEEWEILQTIPVGYTEGVSNTQRYKMIGNGWSVDVISHIFKGLK